MDYFWKENKKFVIAVAGGLAFLAIYFSFVLGPIRGGADAASRERSKARGEIEKRMHQGVPTEDALVAARRDPNRKVLSGMAPEVAFALSDRFALRKGDKAEDVKYDSLRLDLVKELQKKSVDGRLNFPQNVSLPDEMTDENAAEVLARLAVVERMTLLCIESEIEKIEAIDAQHGMDRDARRKSTFLAKHTVLVKLVGKQEAIFKVLHGAQKKGSFLAVTQFDMTRPDATKDQFEATIVVAFLKVDDKAVLETR